MDSLQASRVEFWRVALNREFSHLGRENICLATIVTFHYCICLDQVTLNVIIVLTCNLVVTVTNDHIDEFFDDKRTKPHDQKKT